MGTLARIVTGRRSKWLVVLVWLMLTVPFGRLGAELGDVTDNRTESVLPAEAESTEALHVQEQRFPGGETVNGLIVYKRPGALTDADRAEIAADAGEAARELPLTAPPAIPFADGSPPELVSPAGDLAYTIVTLPADNDRIAEWGTHLRDVVHADTPAGLEVYVTGGLGFNADFEEVFGDIDVKVLLVTVVLVVVLLLLIYRSPVIALIPLAVVFIAYTIARGLVYLYAESGATVSDNGATILVVLMFGVGTDYCLLLVSRYREELRRHEDKHDAMELAIRRSGPAILASGLTVALTMLVLLVADIGSTRSLGPVSALGVTVAFVAGLDPAAGAAHRHRSRAASGRATTPSTSGPTEATASARASGAASASASSGARAWRWPRRSSCSASAASGCSPTRRTTASRTSSRSRPRAPTASPSCSRPFRPARWCRRPCWSSAATAR